MKKFIISILLFASFYSYGQNNTNIIQSNNRFAFDAYNQLAKLTDNLIFSPASITSALTMTAIGAKNNTYEEISSTFYFIQDKTELGEGYYNTFGNKSLKSKSISLYNANSLWIEETLNLNESFKDLSKKYFNSSLHVTDFLNNPEKSRNEINSWVEKNTNNRIKDLLKPSVIDNTTRLVLVNAIYFKGPWKKQFKQENNTLDDFQIGRRKFTQKKFMNTQIISWYYEDKYAEIIDIPYSDPSYSLMIILPKNFKRMRCLEKKLSYDYYENYTKHKEKRRIKLSIPKFDIESEYDLNETLQKMGIKEAFTSTADFSGITKQERLYISKVIHKANISVDENGTEAAAATAVTMRKTSVLIESANFRANRPFIYILRNNKNNCIYFMGKISNPEN